MAVYSATGIGICAKRRTGPATMIESFSRYSISKLASVHDRIMNGKLPEVQVARQVLPLTDIPNLQRL